MKIRAEPTKVRHAVQLLRRHKLSQQAHTPSGEGQSQSAADNREHESFNSKLVEEPRGRCAERATHCDFAATALGASEQQGGHVDPGNQQQKTCAGEQ
jgi:hypothetical protein